jgi:dynein heavy chain
VSELCLRLYLDEYDQTPWDALRYLIAEINYGGRVTDDMDRRLMNTYMAQFFCDDAIQTANFKLSSLSSYVIPEDGPLPMYKEVCAGLPAIDRPEAFGQHQNADLASAITSGNAMLEVITSLQPKVVDASGMSPQDMVYGLAGDLISAMPEPINIYQLSNL